MNLDKVIQAAARQVAGEMKGPQGPTEPIEPEGPKEPLNLEEEQMKLWIGVAKRK